MSGFEAARHDLNILDERSGYYGFVFDIHEDCDAAGRWIVDVELLDKKWWDRTWRELGAKGGARLEQFFGTSDFDAVYPDIPADIGTLMFELHTEYIRRLSDPSAPGPVGLMQVVLTPSETERKELMTARWYFFELGTARAYAADADYESAVEREAVFSEHALWWEDDPPPKLRDLLRLTPTRPPTEALLKAMHLPQGPEAGDDLLARKLGGGEGSGGPSIVPATSGEGSGNQAAPAAAARGIAARVMSRLREWADAAAKLFFPWDGPPPLPAMAGGAPPMFVPTDVNREEDREELRIHAPIAYVGGPLVAPMGAQVPNPMLRGAGPHQPFVAVYNIGQGNCCALYDNLGRVITYFDIGMPKNTKVATAPAALYPPCFHDDPMVIISHWDYDHIGLARRQTNSWDALWVAPQQHLGAASARGVYANIINSGRGGRLYRWPGHWGVPPVEHVATPWGFLERGTRSNQPSIGGGPLNDGGLIAYVCVRDAPGAVPVGGALPVAAPFSGRAGGPVPLTIAARASAAATDALMAPIALHWPKIAEAATIAVGEFVSVAGGVAPAANVIADAAETAVRHLAGGGGAGWLAILNAIGGAPPPPAIAAAPITAAAATLHAAVAAHGAQPDAGAAIIAAEAVAVNAITGLGPAPEAMVAAAAIADAAAAEAAVPGGTTVANLTTAARLSAAGMSTTAAIGQMMPIPGSVVAANTAGTNAGARATRIATATRYSANAVAGASTEVADLGGVAPALPAATCVAAAGAAVRSALGGAGWAAVLGAVAAAPGCAAISAAAAPLGLVLALAPGAPATAEAAASDRRINAAGTLAGVAAMPIVLEDVAAAASVTDTAAFAVGAMPGPPQIEITARAREVAYEIARDAGLIFSSIPAPVILPMAYAGPGGVPGGHLAIAGGALVAADAPFDFDERYILLPGDASTYFVPSTRFPDLGAFGAAAHSPAVVGFVPSHHGAATVFGGTLNNILPNALDERSESKARIPWAPGSSAAAAGAAAGAASSPPFGAGTPETVSKAVAACAGYAGAELARATGRFKPAAFLLPADLGHLGSWTAETAYPGGAGWLATLQGAAWPTNMMYDASVLTQCAARMVPVLGALGGPPASAAAAIAAVPGWAPIVGYPNLAELAAAVAIADAAVAVLGVPAMALGAALAAFVPTAPAAVGAAAHGAAAQVAATAGVALPGVAPVAAALAQTIVIAMAAASPQTVQAVAGAAAFASAEVANAAGLGLVASANIIAAATAAVAAAGGGWEAALRAQWVPGVNGLSVTYAAAALSPVLRRAPGAPGSAAAAVLAAPANVVPLYTPSPTITAVAAIAAIADAVVAVGAGNAAGPPARLTAAQVALASEKHLANPAVGAAGIEAGNANALTGALAPGIQQVAAAAASAAAEVAAAAGEAIIPAAAIVAASMAAAAAVGGGWAACVTAIAGAGAGVGDLAIAATAFGAPWGPPASAQAVAATFPSAVAELSIRRPNAAEIAAVAAAVDAAVAVTGLAGPAFALASTASAAALTARDNTGVAFAVPFPAAQEVHPGAAAGHPYYEVSAATIQAAIEPDLRMAAGGAMLGIPPITRRQAESVLELPLSRKVAYSYGVHSVALTHPYPAAAGPGLAAYGHAHPRAVLEYAGRGWTDRLNTSVDAWQGAQPDPFPAVIAAVGGGHVALGWEEDPGNLPVAAPYEGPLRGDDPANAPGRITRNVCPLCGPVEFSC